LKILQFYVIKDKVDFDLLLLMKILSIDVGVKNLSYIVVDIVNIDSNPVENNWNILKWEKINLIHSYSDLNYVSREYFKWTIKELQDCSQVIKLDITSAKSKKEILLCFSFFFSTFKSRDITLQELCQKVISHFDTYLPDIIFDNVIIENQPCMKNPRMKTMQMIIFTYFAIASHRSLTPFEVCCVSAGRKLSFCKEIGWIIEISTNDYKKTKSDSVRIVSGFNDVKEHDSWRNTKKKDDLSDVYLQALAFAHTRMNSITKIKKVTKITKITKITKTN
jgi:hypothetical protein